ncbi:tight adherence protein B [Thermomonospora echinospora]|uniref:Tight adherence protein B n=1 Tax=Thermomonospora echinospora TaxID=1992 RepID=A0A1H6A4D0_9ACTN|nr:type II secretion system F family protein [Thermomonospora echinospora]SEG43599.1 tight adherence protein B [Thermomonospora echinospora]
MSLPTILLMLAFTLAISVWGVGELAAGYEQRRRLTERAVLGHEDVRQSLLSRLDRRLARTEFGRAVGRRLVAAGVRIGVSAFLLLLGAAVVLAVMLISRWLAPAFGLAAALVVGWMAFGYLRRLEERRKEEFIAQLPELARVMSNATQAGLSLRTAVEIAAEELGEPAKSELSRTADALRLGQSLESALRDLANRLPSRELGVLISTMIVAARSGGSLVTSLRSIAGTLEDRKELRREVKTIMGEAVISNWTVGVFGLLGLVLIEQIQPGTLQRMSENPVGQLILVVAGGLFAGSLLIIQRMTRIDV